MNFHFRIHLMNLYIFWLFYLLDSDPDPHLSMRDFLNADP